MGYYDDDQDLDRWLQSQQAPSLDPTPSAAGGGGDQPGMWARAAQLLGSQARNNTPDPSPKPSALDSWGTILGMLASRDPGSVLSQDAAHRQAAVDAWQKRQAARDDDAFGRQAQLAGLLISEKKADQQSDPLRWQQAQERIDNARALLDLRQGSQQDLRDWRGQQANFESPLNQTKMKLREEGAGASVRGAQEAKHELNAEMAADAANIAGQRAGASTTATNRANAATPPPITPKEQAALSSQYNDDLDAAMSIAEKARQLQALFKDKKDLPGVGMWDASKPDAMKSPDDIKAQELFAAFANPTFKEFAGRAVTGAEAERVNAMVGNLKSTNEETVRNAVDEIYNTMAGKIRSGSKGREAIAREVLGARGLADLLDSNTSALNPETPKAVQPPAAGASSGAADGHPDVVQVTDPTRLPTTGAARRDVPSLPSEAKSVGDEPKTYRLKSKQGRTGSMSLTQDQLQKFIDAGWTVL